MLNKKLITALVFLVTTSFYLYTLSPSLAWGDGVKLQSEAIAGESFVLADMPPENISPDPYPFSKVGVAAWDHPLYFVFGYLLVHALPFVDSLWLINFISAIFGAASITMVFVIAHRLTNALPVSLYAAFALAVSHTFWWHSSTPEVYTLFIFLLLVSYLFFDDFEQSKKDSSLVSGAFFLGLSASNHILGFLAVPAIGLYFLLSKKIPQVNIGGLKKIAPAILAFLAGFSLYIVQFIRISASFSVAGTMGGALGSVFLTRLDFLSLTQLATSIITYLFYLLFQFGPHGIIIGILGIRRTFADKNQSSQKILAFFVVYFLFGIFYRVTDQFAFFLTSYVFFAMLMAKGASYLFDIVQAKLRLALTGILTLTILLTPPLYGFVPELAARNGIDDTFLGIPKIGTGLRNGFAYYINPNKRGDFNPYNFGYETITNLEPNAVIVAEWYTDTDEYFILRYFHRVAGMRPDVTVLGWVLEDPFAFDSQIVVNLIQETLPHRSVYLASLSEKFYNASTLIATYCIRSENNIYRVYPREDDSQSCLDASSVTE